MQAIVLNEQQRIRALEAMQTYLAARSEDGSRAAWKEDAEFDTQRATLIEQELKPLVYRFLTGEVPLPHFKSTVDGINKRNQLWGFKGIKGQMFFNMVVNTADDLEQCAAEVKAAITLPESEQIASSRIKTFASYVGRLASQWIEGGNSAHGCPKVGSIPFFLSYFWQVQNRDIWPVYYTTGVKAMTDLNLWQPTEDLAEDYLAYKHVHEELVGLFSQQSGRCFHLYDVEHVFWFMGASPRLQEKKAVAGDGQTPVEQHEVSVLTRLPESYVPPIIAVLPRIARREQGLDEIAHQSGITVERAFEKYIDAGFTILGYDTKLLGQGQGRVPDGLAIAVDYSYAILWDAKVRTNGYSMGTDDRAIREYIATQSRELKKRRSLRNIYYLIISSSFADDFDDTIRSLKMETDVNEVALVEADALVAMVDAKLRAPLQVTLGPDGLQRLFSVSGILTADMVREQQFV